MQALPTLCSTLGLLIWVPRPLGRRLPTSTSSSSSKPRRASGTASLHGSRACCHRGEVDRPERSRWSRIAKAPTFRPGPPCQALESMRFSIALRRERGQDGTAPAGKPGAALVREPLDSVTQAARCCAEQAYPAQVKSGRAASGWRPARVSRRAAPYGSQAATIRWMPCWSWSLRARCRRRYRG